MPDSPPKTTPKWHHPQEVMKLHKLKQKKKALQARINGNILNCTSSNVQKTLTTFDDVLAARKRKNPFITNSNDDNKRPKNEESNNSCMDESTDQTLFKLLHHNSSSVENSFNDSLTTFNNILNKINDKSDEHVAIVKAKGEKWLPIDWTLKNKMRLLSTKPFPWNSKLKISEEASGITAFSRCLHNKSEATLDTSPNARFYQCCLFWQQPSLPWLKLFPRTSVKSIANSNTMVSTIRDSLQTAWSDSLRSLFQLIRTRQCPYFYACANNFTVLFRAAGICGYSSLHAFVTPTSRGFRQILRQEDIEFSMPLKKDIVLNMEDEIIGKEEEETPNEQWLKSMGCNAEDIKQINYTQEKIVRKTESKVDNSEESLILIEGMEVHAFYNFLINCKSATALTGPLAGIPPTLLAPVSFHGATLNSLKVRENKVHVDDVDYYSLELSGPILPSTIHNLFDINSPEHSLTVTFNNLINTESFSKVVKSDAGNNSVVEGASGSAVFGKENLSDCGLHGKVLKHFCSMDPKYVTNVECLKYTSDCKTYTWN